MRVHILAKREFDGLMATNKITDENVGKMDSIFFISIIDTDTFSESREPYFKEDHANVLNLRFDDVEHDLMASSTQAYDARAFTEEQAKILYSFIKAHREKETCIVHCMAGISRSGAVGTFVNGYCGGDWELFKRDNPMILPNARVHRMLNAAKYNDF